MEEAMGGIVDGMVADGIGWVVDMDMVIITITTKTSKVNVI